MKERTLEHYFLAGRVAETFGSLAAFEARLVELFEAGNLAIEWDRDYSDLDGFVRAIVVWGSDSALVFLRCGLDGFW